VAEELADLAAAPGADYVQVDIPHDTEDGVVTALEQGGVSCSKTSAFESYDMAE
jgi:hypothetical protein